MTATGACFKCGKTANTFHYDKPYTGSGEHKGYWHCQEHGHEGQMNTILSKIVEDLDLDDLGSDTTSPNVSVNTAGDSTYANVRQIDEPTRNRAERRKYEKMQRRGRR